MWFKLHVTIIYYQYFEAKHLSVVCNQFKPYLCDLNEKKYKIASLISTQLISTQKTVESSSIFLISHLMFRHKVYDNPFQNL